MKRQTKKELLILLILVFILSIFSGLNIFTPAPSQFKDLENYVEISKLSLSFISFFGVFFIYSIFGVLGLYISKKISLVGIYLPDKKLKEQVFHSVIFGILTGIFLIFIERFFVYFFNFPKMPHTPFPYLFLGLPVVIGEEIFYRLFLISLLSLCFLFLLKKLNLNKTRIVWFSIILSSFIFGAIHIPLIIFLYDFNSLSLFIIFLTELLSFNLFLGIITGKEFIRFGLISAILIRLFADLVWNLLSILF